MADTIAVVLPVDKDTFAEDSLEIWNQSAHQIPRYRVVPVEKTRIREKRVQSFRYARHEARAALFELP